MILTDIEEQRVRDMRKQMREVINQVIDRMPQEVFLYEEVSIDHLVGVLLRTQAFAYLKQNKFI